MIGNPYTSVRIKKLKRRSSARYAVACILCVPVYLLYLLATGLRWVGVSLARWLIAPLRRLFAPFDSFSVFVTQWFASRPWKNLLWVVPLALVLLVLSSMLFLAYNRPQENIFKAYKRFAYEAIGNDDHELASFYFGKAIYLPEASGEPMLLYQAMLNADRLGNHLRTQALLAQLIDEHDYTHAHMWQATRLLATRQNDRSNTQRAIEHMKQAIEGSDNPQMIRIELARLYFQSGRLDLAINILEGTDEQNWSVLLLKANIQMVQGDENAAVDSVMKILNALELSQETIVENAGDYLGAVSLLKQSSLSKSLAAQKMEGVIELIEKNYESNPNDSTLKRNLARAYQIKAGLILGRITGEEPCEALRFMDKAILVDGINDQIINDLFRASNVAVTGGLTLEELRLALCQGWGVGVAHLLLAVNEWRERDMSAAAFHMRNAHAQNPVVLDAMYGLSLRLASSLESRGDSSFSNILNKEPEWKRVFSLLDLVVGTKPDSRNRVLLAKIRLLSDRQRWGEVIVQAEAGLESADEATERSLLTILIRAHKEMRDQRGVQKYTQLLRGLAE